MPRAWEDDPSDHVGLLPVIGVGAGAWAHAGMTISAATGMANIHVFNAFYPLLYWRMDAPKGEVA